LSPQTGSPTFLYVPRAANILREREQHIEKLGKQVAEINQDRTQLLDLFRKQTEELEQQASGYEAKIIELEAENRKNAEWALETERRLTLELVGRSHELESKCQELAECVRLLHETERTVEERTNWALKLGEQIRQLDDQIRQLNASLHLLRASRWVKLGNALGMGPRLRDG
jgi:chromosome segregation ATPase